MNKLLSNEELLELEEKASNARYSENVFDAKRLYEVAARSGSGSACMDLACSYEPLSTSHPESYGELFTKNRRRSIRYYYRALKCLRRQARLGSHPAMFNLYNMYNFVFIRSLCLKNRRRLAEYWLRRSAECGANVPSHELKLYLRDKNG